MAYHIYPVNDTKEHLLESTLCDCSPCVFFENGEMLIVHHSYDGREGLEMANEIINKHIKNGTKIC